MGPQADTKKSEFSFLGSSSEAKRLQSQHHLAVNAFGGQILCPADLSKPSFRALDSCGADGFWLTELRRQLAHPDSATLIGTDISSYPTDALPSNVSLIQHNMMDAYPEDWAGTFDLVHQRAAVAFHPTWETALEATRRQVALLKPGAWIQLVDSVLPTGAVDPADPPSARFLKTMGNAMPSMRLNTSIGTRLDDLLREAGGLEAVQTSRATVRLGRGAGSPLLEEMGYEELEKMGALVTMAVEKLGYGVFTKEELQGLLGELREEARREGVELEWYAAWARKPL
ncbi:putative methyltransferase protein [Neofusicoccum parvum UCRNP2]|uniref:Putative methyltransferase protein n=1 Tax=Botryosphaeria parva (strain UCR-NP2) TaxID=1287680 RepID=R1E6Q8_BOTPV|nr:putative methyltransferase protein [Neofusicoccum parvum UCRNP2]